MFPTTLLELLYKLEEEVEEDKVTVIGAEEVKSLSPKESEKAPLPEL